MEQRDLRALFTFHAVRAHFLTFMKTLFVNPHQS